MTTQRKRARQQRALARLIKRIDFWGDMSVLDEPVEVDGKKVLPAMKLAVAHGELDNLERKGIKP